jgi:hypothetical protein
MFMISARTVIHTPADVVWQVLMDFSAYKQWSTMLMPEQDTPPQLGTTIKLRLALSDGPAYSFEPMVIALDENRHFAWRQKTGIRGVFDGEHHFELKPFENGQTDLHNYEHYSGLLSPLFKRLPMMQGALAGFEAMNAEIKMRAEAISL